MDLPAPLNWPSTCYHEAGHCIVAWHYGITIEYVSVRPSEGDDHSWAGHTKPADRVLTTVAEFEHEMQFAAAGSIATDRRRFPSDAALITRFEYAIRLDARYPHHTPNDESTFAKVGLIRDRELLDADPGIVTGPPRWVPIWREAHRLVAIELWPAVQALAKELMYVAHDPGNDEISAIAAAAIAGAR